MRDFVTVILPVYNASHYLKEAVNSILNQTYKKFEFIIINDGSTDGCCDFLSNIDDHRIKRINHEKNKGLIETLNEAIELSQGEFIVRMDADDISYPYRIQTLLDYMKANPRVGIAGSYTNLTGNSLFHTKYLNSDEIKSRLLFDNVYSHPTMIFRKTVFSENGIYYNKKYHHAEDYGLWMELMHKTEYGIVPVPLLKYGVHQNQVSKIHREIQMDTVGIIHRMVLHKFNFPIHEDELNLHKKLFFKNYENSIHFFKKAEHWLLKLREYNSKTGIFNVTSFNNITSWVWFEIATHLVTKRICNIKIFRNSLLYNPQIYNRSFLLKYRIKSLYCL
jgi:glycosyltransferase involved in cell wall biosynthesis